MPSTRLINAIETFKDVGLFFGSDSYPRVFNAYCHAVCLTMHGDRYGSARVIVVNPVPDIIFDNIKVYHLITMVIIEK